MIRSGLIACLCFLFSIQLMAQQGDSPVLMPNKPLGKRYSLETLEDALHGLFPELQDLNTHLSLIQKRTSPGATHYTFQQLYHGKPVHGARLYTHIDHGGKIRVIQHNLVKIPSQGLPPFAMKSARVQADIKQKYGAYDLSLEPVYLLNEKQLHAAYRITGFSHGPVYSFELILDAASGKELSWTDLGLSLRPTGDTTALARVFNPNPCTKANVNYGDVFIDSMDYHKAIFDQLMDTVVLQDLCFENDSFRLKGSYVQIVDLEAPDIAPVASADGTFFFRRDEVGFEQVMAYYHIDRFQRWVQELGFRNLSNGSLMVDAEGTLSDNSVTVIKDSVPNILFGLGGVDDAEDADVIIHEYGHALSYYATGEVAKNGSLERVGLDEGIGDYLAAIYSENQGYTNWALLFNWDGHNEFWPGRIANGMDNYPPPDSSIYTYGGIWASALLELRDILGRSTTDSLFFEELYLNTLQMDLPQAAQMLIMADSLLFGGSHVEEIQFVFCERGLLPNLKGDCSVVSAPDPSESLEPSIAIYPNPSSGLLGIRFPQQNFVGKFTCIVFDQIGNKVYEKSLASSHEILDLSWLSRGIYHLRILKNGVGVISKKIVLTPEN